MGFGSLGKLGQTTMGFTGGGWLVKSKSRRPQRPKKKLALLKGGKGQSVAVLTTQSECERNTGLEYGSVEEFEKRKVIFAILRPLAPVSAK